MGEVFVVIAADSRPVTMPHFGIALNIIGPASSRTGDLCSFPFKQGKTELKRWLPKSQNKDKF